MQTQEDKIQNQISGEENRRDSSQDPRNKTDQQFYESLNFSAHTFQ